MMWWVGMCVVMQGAVQSVGPSGVAAPAGDAKVHAKVSARFETRLVALKPERWWEYFVLAEEVADGAVDEEQTRLATELYVLAFALANGVAGEGADGKVAGGVSRAGPLVGLAALERRDVTRRWLMAMAAGVDGRYARGAWAEAGVVGGDVALRAAMAIGLARAGEGREARRLLSEPGVSEMLKRYERAIGEAGELGAVGRLEQYAAQWPCPECGNQRTVTRSGPGGTRTTVCPTCGGEPGPRLSRGELVAQLRFEAMLLSPLVRGGGGVQRSWAAQRVVDGGAPLRDSEPGDVPGVYGVDVAKACWVAGVGWSACAGGVKAPAKGGTTVPIPVVPLLAPEAGSSKVE